MLLPPAQVREQALSLKGKDRLVTLMALKLVFPYLGTDLEWGDEIEATKKRLKLSREEGDEIADRVLLMAGELRRQIYG